jgi:hypothetical protein
LSGYGPLRGSGNGSNPRNPVTVIVDVRGPCCLWGHAAGRWVRFLTLPRGVSMLGLNPVRMLAVYSVPEDLAAGRWTSEVAE